LGFPTRERVFAANINATLLALNGLTPFAAGRCPDLGGSISGLSPPTANARADPAQLLVAGDELYRRPGGSSHVWNHQQALIPSRLEHRHERDPLV